MAHYIALIHKDPDSDFGVSFPDFPGCITAGNTIQEASEMAREALGGHISAMVEEGLPIPGPSSLDQIMAELENRDGVAVLIAAPATEDRAVRLNVTLPESLVRRIDEVSRNRSRFLAEAAEDKLASGR
jgi:predicted RNase H-like HicB family nuclease